MEKVKVYCLPYAGGSASIYYDWKKRYASVAEIIPIEYNGHGSLFGKSLYMEADEAADDIYNRICNDNPQNYILFGHSMGSLLALLVAIRLEKREYGFLPRAIIAGGTRPPHLKHKDEQLTHLPKNEFMDKIFGLGQMDPEIMNEPELLDMLYEIFYADTKLCEEYRYDESLPGVSIPMVIMTGSEDDEAPLDEMKEWGMYTSGSFNINEFAGDHFFPFNCEEFAGYFSQMIDKAASSELQ